MPTTNEKKCPAEGGDHGAGQRLNAAGNSEKPASTHVGVTTPRASQIFFHDPAAARAAIADVLERYPWLGIPGQRLATDTVAEFLPQRVELLTDCGVGQVIRATEVLEYWPRQDAPNPDLTSYAWKHIAERLHERRRGGDRRQCDIYISNGALIAAALHLKVPGSWIRGSRSAHLGLRTIRHHYAWPNELIEEPERPTHWSLGPGGRMVPRYE